MICIHNEWFICPLSIRWLIWMTTTSASCAYETIPFFGFTFWVKERAGGGEKRCFGMSKQTSGDFSPKKTSYETLSTSFFSEAMTTLLQQFPVTWFFSYTKIRPNSYFWTKYCSFEPTFLTLTFRLKDPVCPCEDTKRSCKRFWFLHSGF